MNKIDKKKPLSILGDFPKAGATVLCFFHDTGEDEIKGYYYVGLVVSSGSKEFKINWRGSDDTEKFTSIEGKNEYYSHFSIIGYISYEDYYKYKKNKYKYKKVKKIKYSSEPCEKSVFYFNKQKEYISDIKNKEKQKQKNDYEPSIDLIKVGTKIRFIYVHLLDEPKIMTKFVQKGENDNRIYIDTNGEDKIYIDNDKDRKTISKPLIIEYPVER